MRRVLLVLLCALLLPPFVAVAKSPHAHPHLITAPDSITVPAIVPFGGSFTPEYTFGGTLGATESLWIRATCSASAGIDWDQWRRAGGTFTTGVTPTWTGEPATCFAYLIVIDSFADVQDTYVVSASFEVLP